MKRAARAALAALAAMACRGAPPATGGGERLAEGTLAVVGEEHVDGRTVVRVANAQGIPPRRALELALSDAVFAAAARRELAPEAVRVVEAAALARALLDVLAEEARAAGPPTPAEVDAVLERRWPELDRPVTVRTTHAVVRRQPGEDAAALALARRLREAIGGATSASDLRARVEAVDAQGLDVRVEELGPCTPDGRVVPSRAFGGTTVLVAEYAAAAHALQAPGDLSDPVRTEFGYHVIRLEERLPERRVPRERLVELVTPEVYGARSRAAMLRLVEPREATIEVERGAEELTASVPVE